MSGHGRSSESTGTGNKSAREPPPCLNTKKCAGEKHYFTGYPNTESYEAIVLFSEFKNKRDPDKKKANFKTLGNKGATADNRDGQTAYLTAENLGVILVYTGSDYLAILRSDVEDARRRVFPLKVEVLPESIMLSMAIRGERDKQMCSATQMLISAVTITTPSGPLWHAWSATEHCRRRYGPSIDRKAGLRRQCCSRNLGCDQMMTLFSLTM
jgi:hypothetical protein